MNSLTSNRKLENIDFIYIVIVYLLLLILFFFSGFRFEVGTDYEGYVAIFEIILSEGVNEVLIEPGFEALIVIIQLFSENPQYLFVLSTLFILFFLYKGIKEQTSSILFSLVLFVELYQFFYSLNIIRQYMAIVVCFVALKYVKEKKFFTYFWCVLFAALFHFSAILMVFVYPILRLKVTNLTITFYFLVFALFFLFYSQLAYLLAQVFPKYVVYLEGEDVGGAALILIFVVIVLFGAIFKLKQLSFINEYSAIYINGLFLSIPLLLLAYVNIVFFRLSLFFLVYLIILIPSVTYSFGGRNYYNVYSYIIFLILLPYFLKNLVSNVSGVFPLAFNFNI